MYEVLHQRRISIEVIAGEKQYFLWYQHKQNKFIHSNYTWLRCSLLTSAVITGVQMGEMSKLGWLIGWSSRDMWADSLYFLYVVLGPICKTFASFQCINVPSSQTFRSYPRHCNCSVPLHSHILRLDAVNIMFSECPYEEARRLRENIFHYTLLHPTSVTLRCEIFEFAPHSMLR
jgi:hypothetical protein